LRSLLKLKTKKIRLTPADKHHVDFSIFAVDVGFEVGPDMSPAVFNIHPAENNRYSIGSSFIDVPAPGIYARNYGRVVVAGVFYPAKCIIA